MKYTQLSICPSYMITHAKGTLGREEGVLRYTDIVEDSVNRARKECRKGVKRACCGVIEKSVSGAREEYGKSVGMAWKGRVGKRHVTCFEGSGWSFKFNWGDDNASTVELNYSLGISIFPIQYNSIFY